MTLVLEALRSDQSLDLGSLGVWLLSLTLGLNLTSNDVLANLLSQRKSSISLCFSSWYSLTLYPNCSNSATAVIG